jgi:hypothetical protein
MAQMIPFRPLYLPTAASVFVSSAARPVMPAGALITGRPDIRPTGDDFGLLAFLHESQWRHFQSSFSC